MESGHREELVEPAFRDRCGVEERARAGIRGGQGGPRRSRSRETVKAAWYTRQGPPAEVMQFGEQPTPHAARGEIRVRVHASAVNPADSNRCVGRSYAMEGPLIIPNSDGSGVVDEIGAGV